MVTEKQPSPTEEARWTQKEKLGRKTQKEEEIRKVSASCDRFCLLFKSSFSLVSIRRDCSAPGKSDPQMSVSLIHTHIETHTHPYIHTYTCTHIAIHMHAYRNRHIHIHTHTHTHHNLQSFVVHETLTCAPSGTYSFWVRKESLENQTWAFPASTQKWHIWHHPRFIAQNESLRTGNTAIWQVLLSTTSFSRPLDSSAVSFFSPWRSFRGTALWRNWAWSYALRVGDEGIFCLGSFGWCVSDSWLHLSLCWVGLVRFVSPLSPTSLLHSVSLTAEWFSAFVHAFISLVIQHLLSSFYVSLLDLKETLKNKT